MKAKVKNHSDLVKDMNSGAILSCNLQQHDEYMAKKAAMIAKRKAISTEERLNKLENDINEIKELLIRTLK